MVYIYKGNNDYEYISLSKIICNVLLLISMSSLLICSSIFISETPSSISLLVIDTKTSNLTFDIYVQIPNTNITTEVCGDSSFNFIQTLFSWKCIPIEYDTIQNPENFLPNHTSTFWILNSNIYLENPYSETFFIILYSLIFISSAMLLVYICRILYFIYDNTCSRDYYYIKL